MGQCNHLFSTLGQLEAMQCGFQANPGAPFEMYSMALQSKAAFVADGMNQSSSPENHASQIHKSEYCSSSSLLRRRNVNSSHFQSRKFSSQAHNPNRIGDSRTGFTPTRHIVRSHTKRTQSHINSTCPARGVHKLEP